jgi:tungstate transport system ATP-binding protein
MNPYHYRLTAVQSFYGSKLALELDELAIAWGGLHVLCGSNGSGKSTLLHLLALLKQPDCGQLWFDGEEVHWKGSELSRLRQRVTLLHQHSYLFTGTVFSNVAFCLKVRGVGRDKDELQRGVSEALAMVGMEEFESRDARKLSGGEARRVALARSLACQPEVLLLDEPLAYVDKESARIIEALILSLASRGTTVVMASHNEHFGDGVARTVIRLADGKVEQVSGTSAGPGEVPVRSVDCHADF